MSPTPIQRSRKPGAKHPKGTLFVDRTNKDFGNPYVITKNKRFCGVSLLGNYFRSFDGENALVRATAHAVEKFRERMASIKEHNPKKYASMMARVRAASYIACFCPVTEPDCYCHRSVLIELAEELP